MTKLSDLGNVEATELLEQDKKEEEDLERRQRANVLLRTEKKVQQLKKKREKLLKKRLRIHLKRNVRLQPKGGRKSHLRKLHLILGILNKAKLSSIVLFLRIQVKKTWRF